MADRGDLRRRIVQELVDTEERYISGLEGLNTVYKEFLEKYLSPANFKALFKIIEPIIKFSKVMLVGLQNRMERWDDDACVGDVMVKAIPLMKLYADYPRIYVSVKTELERLHKNDPRAMQVLDLIIDHDQLKGDQGLQCFLVYPVSRFPRYHLLLQDLSKRTPPEHPDSENIEKALNNLIMVSKEINDRINENERQR
eukprot:CAMPEP_0201524018 /NCGR_PEP_ID=MMETSP0161_2-20130828/21052_1 /ASSEMBLY_ACC=CAM_ASM_000251 /TAXON_ID=180227 /ORGANISM="Neoparamoeba aestuarina, Strain SoJaBio B1-5/56/2" /LENGTH=197 /DNA_ID=CAMNT_0047923273 /DNA_START=54 /DNA_END=647 /DNA_ORIENTATION=+